jgi:hypothetical protein
MFSAPLALIVVLLALALALFIGPIPMTRYSCPPSRQTAITGVYACLIPKMAIQSLFCWMSLGNTSANNDRAINQSASFKAGHILFSKQSACRSM